MAAAGVDAILAGGPPMFEALVAQLLMADDTARSQAEAVFEQLKGHPDALVTYFVTLMRSSVSEEHRVFSAIMLRKVRTHAAHHGAPSFPAGTRVHAFNLKRCLAAAHWRRAAATV